MTASQDATAADLAAIDEGQFAVMMAEWALIRLESPVDLVQWERALERMADEETLLRRTGGWMHGPSDYMSVLRLHRDEVKHSRMIAWLMDPCARHGLGDSVLRGVLETVFDDVDAGVMATLGSARPTCEVSRETSRVDILVTAPGLTLVIENKVDAAEGQGQCDEYFRLFSEEVGARFILLTPKGLPPRSATGEALDAFRALSYRQVHAALREGLEKGQPNAAARHVAEDYLRTLEKEFP
jgi:hypothetical protein